MADWNSVQYLKFQAERTQPAIDLVNRIRIDHPQKIIDIGCGPGNSTAVLAQRIPDAYILGVDYSPDMITAAKRMHPALVFKICDAGKDLSMLDHDFDIVFSNACIQWIPNHTQLLKSMMGLLRKGGVLAIQVPMNNHEPIQEITLSVSSSSRWRSEFLYIGPSPLYLSQSEYYDILSEISSEFTIWETTYFHVMNSHADIIEWYRSTGLRPYLNVLTDERKILFEQDIYSELTKKYPVQKDGKIIFKFPRFFFVASL